MCSDLNTSDIIAYSELEAIDKVVDRSQAFEGLRFLALQALFHDLIPLNEQILVFLEQLSDVCPANSPLLRERGGLFENTSV